MPSIEITGRHWLVVDRASYIDIHVIDIYRQGQQLALQTPLRIPPQTYAYVQSDRLDPGSIDEDISNRLHHVHGTHFTSRLQLSIRDRYNRHSIPLDDNISDQKRPYISAGSSADNGDLDADHFNTQLFFVHECGPAVRIIWFSNFL